MRKTLLPAVILIFAGASSADENAQAPDFAGTWVGKWDNTWCVQFTLAEDPTTKDIVVLYEWLEKPDLPLQSHSKSGRLERAKLQIKDPNIEVFFSGTTGQAVALGHFGTLRSAALVRESKRRCQADGTIR
jgi:hypothetical protein